MYRFTVSVDRISVVLLAVFQWAPQHFLLILPNAKARQDREQPFCKLSI